MRLGLTNQNYVNIDIHARVPCGGHTKNTGGVLKKKSEHSP